MSLRVGQKYKNPVQRYKNSHSFEASKIRDFRPTLVSQFSIYPCDSSIPSSSKHLMATFRLRSCSNSAGMEVEPLEEAVEAIEATAEAVARAKLCSV